MYTLLCKADNAPTIINLPSSSPPTFFHPSVGILSEGRTSDLPVYDSKMKTRASPSSRLLVHAGRPVRATLRCGRPRRAACHAPPC